ncbi:MAG: hypothetical protein AAF747_05480, partial [Planctomycetota bacterium]
MMMNLLPRFSAVGIVFVAAFASLAQDRFVRYPDTPAVTFHEIEVDGETIQYVATAGTITMVDGDNPEETTADLFYIAYRKYDAVQSQQQLDRLIKLELDKDHQDRTAAMSEAFGREAYREQIPAMLLAAGVAAGEVLELPDASERPLTFSFNGGPGSSSVWLHLGLFGPKRIDYADADGNPGPPPYAVIENDLSLLSHSDFVFIDPVSTGFSRAEIEASPKRFHGVESDIGSVGEFIRRYISDEQRWGSAKFVAGESYGTTRAAGLAEHLHNRHGINLNGVMLISMVT